jgi:hypothetical protein
MNHEYNGRDICADWIDGNGYVIATCCVGPDDLGNPDSPLRPNGCDLPRPASTIDADGDARARAAREVTDYSSVSPLITTCAQTGRAACTVWLAGDTGKRDETLHAACATFANLTCSPFATSTLFEAEVEAEIEVEVGAAGGF